MKLSWATHIVAGFEDKSDAIVFLDELHKRFEAFDLKLHPEKTRLIEFGRYAADRRKRRGLGKPETFKFLGFVFICGKSRSGKFLLWRRSRRDRMRAKLQLIKIGLRRKMHATLNMQGKWLRAVVMGYFNYHAVPTNSYSLAAFRRFVLILWQRTLRRRSQKDRTTFATVEKVAAIWLPRPKILHPWPSQRFAVKHPGWEPGA